METNTDDQIQNYSGHQAQINLTDKFIKDRNQNFSETQKPLMVPQARPSIKQLMVITQKQDDISREEKESVFEYIREEGDEISFKNDKESLLQGGNTENLESINDDDDNKNVQEYLLNILLIFNSFFEYGFINNSNSTSAQGNNQRSTKSQAFHKKLNFIPQIMSLGFLPTLNEFSIEFLTSQTSQPHYSSRRSQRQVSINRYSHYWKYISAKFWYLSSVSFVQENSDKQSSYLDRSLAWLLLSICNRSELRHVLIEMFNDPEYLMTHYQKPSSYLWQNRMQLLVALETLKGKEQLNYHCQENVEYVQLYNSYVRKRENEVKQPQDYTQNREDINLENCGFQDKTGKAKSPHDKTALHNLFGSNLKINILNKENCKSKNNLENNQLNKEVQQRPECFVEEVKVSSAPYLTLDDINFSDDEYSQGYEQIDNDLLQPQHLQLKNLSQNADDVDLDDNFTIVLDQSCKSKNSQSSFPKSRDSQKEQVENQLFNKSLYSDKQVVRHMTFSKSSAAIHLSEKVQCKLDMESNQK